MFSELKIKGLIKDLKNKSGGLSKKDYLYTSRGEDLGDSCVTKQRREVWLGISLKNMKIFGRML